MVEPIPHNTLIGVGSTFVVSKQGIMDAIIKMDAILVVLEFFGGVLLVLALGWGLGKLFKLDSFDEEQQTTSKKKKSASRWKPWMFRKCFFTHP